MMPSRNDLDRAGDTCFVFIGHYPFCGCGTKRAMEATPGAERQTNAEGEDT